jgi:hydrogenase maturation protein HypF
MIRGGVNAPWTSSAGRLFDAVAAILDIRQIVAFEGQAAMELEFAVGRAESSQPYPFLVSPAGVLDWGPMIQAILEDIRLGSSGAAVARRFHDTLTEMIVATARFVGERNVVVSGGCFQNAYLLEQSVTRLLAAGFVVAWPKRIPPNDGGIALGQILAACAENRSEPEE